MTRVRSPCWRSSHRWRWQAATTRSAIPLPPASIRRYSLADAELDDRRPRHLQPRCACRRARCEDAENTLADRRAQARLRPRQTRRSRHRQSEGRAQARLPHRRTGNARPITLGGRGETLDITFPVHATISARDVGGVLKQETATGAATVHAVATLGIVGDWRPSATRPHRLRLDPAAGDRLPRSADRIHRCCRREAEPVIARLQRDLPQELARLDLRTQLAGAWRQGFTSIMLNRDNPPAWMRVTPQASGRRRLPCRGPSPRADARRRCAHRNLRRPRPADPPPTPLPPPAKAIGARGLNFFIPVLADYAQLEPVVARALRKLAAKGITLKGVGPVDATFGKVTIYATTDSHLAVGVQASAKPAAARSAPPRAKSG